MRILAKKIKVLFLEKKIIARNYREDLRHSFSSGLAHVCSCPLSDFHVFLTLSGGEGKHWPFRRASIPSRC